MDEGWVCGLVWAAVLGIAVEDGVGVSRAGASWWSEPAVHVSELSGRCGDTRADEVGEKKKRVGLRAK